jgi:CrcB protein
MPDMEPSLASCLIVMSGGALGTLARYGVTFATMQLSRAVPWGTILCNVTGSLLIGLVAGLTRR